MNERAAAPVVFAIPRSELGGAQRSLVLLLRALDRAAFPPFVLLAEDGPLVRALADLRVPHEIGPSFRGATGIARFLSVARRTGARILHLFGARTLALAARASGIKVVERVNLLRGSEAGGLVRHAWIDRTLLRLADRVIVPSRAMEEQLLGRGVPAAKLRLVPNGVVLPAPSASRDELRAKLGATGFVVLAIARLVRLKGLDFLLRAFAKARIDGGELWLAGEGPERSALEELARELGVRARFLGDREDVADLIAAADVFVQASRSEVLSNAVLEAMLGGLPVVATDVGGTSEVVRADTGLLVPPGDEEGMSQALLRLARSPEERARLAAGGRALASARSVEAMARATEAVYREVLA